MNEKDKKSAVNEAKAGDRAELLKRALLRIESLDAKLAAAEKIRSEPIAIIGMACRFAAGANDPEAFWRLLEEGRDGITEVPPERWSVEEWYDPDPDAVGKAYTVMGGFIDDVDQFDAAFFGVSPREAQQMDPQQRWLLQVTWEALEDAGLAPDSLVGSQTGVFVGMTGSDFLHLQTGNDPGNIDTYVASGNSHAVAAGRLSYVLGFRGPAITIDTACSSALLSVHLACHSLRIGESDTALAGGVLLLLSPGAYVTACKARLLSPDGHCKTFDDSADGYVRAEGCAMVALKRLSDAERDGDNILAVIRGSASNQDGRSGGLTVPSGTAQEAVIRAALANSGVEAHEVSYVEAHGTGTSLGDPIEVQALDNVYSRNRDSDKPLVIGSVKSNIGHTEALAGVAGLIKLVLALQREKIPGDLHFNTPNTHIPWSDFSIEVADRLLDWPQWAGRKIGGLSSFGFSGTNVHMIVEQAKPPSRKSHDVDRPLHLLTLSARREEAVKELAKQYASRVGEDREDETAADICYTANTGRSHFEYRAVVKGATKSDLKSGLEALASSGSRDGMLRSDKIQPNAAFNVGFFFTGDGSARVNMGRALFETQPVFRRVMTECDQLLRDRLKKPLLSVLYPEDSTASESLSTDLRYAHAAMFAVEWALVEMWGSFGVSPSVVAGHGCGEIAAACAAGIIDFKDGLELAAARGRILDECHESGAMAVVGADADEIRAFVAEYEGIEIAATNAPQSVVIAGDAERIDAVCAELAEKRVETQIIPAALPLHTERMAEAGVRITKAAAEIEHGLPHIDFVSMLSGRVAGNEHGLTPAYWGDQVTNELNVFGALRAVRAHDCRALIEIGPGSSLLTLTRRILPSSYIHWLPSIDAGGNEWDRVLTSLSSLYVAGMDIDWPGFDKEYVRHKVKLPTYPFDRQIFPIKELQAPRQFEDVSAYLHPLVGRQLRSPRIHDWIWEARLGPDDSGSGDYRYHGCAIVAATAHVEAMIIVGREVFPDQDLALSDFEHIQTLNAGNRKIVQAIASSVEESVSVDMFSADDVGPSDAPDWAAHSRGQLQTLAEPDSVAVSAEDRARWEERCKEQWPGAQLYEILKESGVTFDPEYRTVESLQRRDGEVVGRVRGAPGLLEACSHLAQVALPGMPTLRAGAGLATVQAVEHLWLGRELPESLYVHGVIREAGDDGTTACDMQLYDTEGRQVGGMAGIVHTAVQNHEIPEAYTRGLDRWLYAVDWKEQALPPAEAAADQRKSWLVFADDADRLPALAEMLGSEADQVKVVRPGKALKDGADGVWSVDAMQADDVAELLRRVAADGDGAELTVVYLLGLDVDEPATGEHEPTDTAAVACEAFLNVVRASLELESPASLAIVTRGAQPVAVSEGSVSLMQSSFVGLQRVLASEHAELGTRIIDIDPNGDADAAQLADELRGGIGSEDRQVALRGGRRYVPRLVRSEPELSGDEGRSIDFSEGAFLITGGLGGVGLTVVEWLVHQGARHLFLMGRSGASEQAQKNIAALKALGASVEVVKGDVAEFEDVRSAIETIDATGIPLRGVYHAAGVLDDALLAGQNRKRFEKVLRPKVNGTWNLHTLTADRELDQFVLFSAAAALFGNPGQSNYAAANLFLDGMAHYRHSIGLPALSINWGAWAQVGMAAALGSEAHDRWAQLGVGQIDPREGADAMGRALLQGVPQLAVMPINWAQWRRAFPGGRPPPFTSELLQGAGETSIGGPSISSLLARLSSDDADRGIHLGEYVSRQLAVLLGLVPESIDREQPVSDLGFDSLMATTLKTQVMTDLGIDIPVAAILDGPSANDLADRLLAVFDASQVGPDVRPSAPGITEAAEIDTDWEEGTL